ncbi:hypothetical protein [Micromonospora aurantiaca (nom. illeg.)]|uniref:hypothetical protein n=1 Tax=Micromonospora aurantiaca (nom. illeg.) TaxID=47850 RepID=UPI0033FDFD5B
MGLADMIRVWRGNLTPEEIAERDDRARRRRARLAQDESEQAARKADVDLYQQRLDRAAGVASATVVCHRDTWNFISRWASQRTSWQEPASRKTQLSDDMLQVNLSGPQIVMILIVMRDASGRGSQLGGVDAAFLGDRVIADRIYRAVGAVVDTVDPSAPDGTPLSPIVIDDRASPLPQD